MVIEVVACLLAAGRLGRRGRAHVTPVIAVLFSLGAALAYGLSDFLGGVVSRRTSVWPVALLACAGAALGTLVLALVVTGDTDARPTSPGACSPESAAARALPSSTAASPRAGWAWSPRSPRSVPPCSPRRSPCSPASVRAPWSGRAWSPRSRASGWSRASHRHTPMPPADSAEGFVDGILAGAGFGRALRGPRTGARGGRLLAGHGARRSSRCSPWSWPRCCSAVIRGPARPRSTGGWRPDCSRPWPSSASCSPATQGLLSVAAVLTSLYPAFTVLLASLLLGSDCTATSPSDSPCARSASPASRPAERMPPCWPD